MSPKDNPKELLASQFTPFSLRRGRLQAIGPSGNSLMARVVDLINVHFSLYGKILHLYCIAYYRLFHRKGLRAVEAQERLFSRPKGLVKWIGVDSLVSYRDLLLKRKNPKLKRNLNNGVLARLSYFKDGAGKWRYIAIGDWVTQSALFPLHSLLFGILRRIPSDCTFDQNKIASAYQENYGLKPIYSIDLSAATDRLPLTLQVALLQLITGR